MNTASERQSVQGNSDERINPYSVQGWKRHGLIVSSTAPAFLLIGIFFVFRWVLIGGEQAGEFFRTAVLFTAVGTVLVILNVVVRRQIESDDQS